MFSSLLGKRRRCFGVKVQVKPTRKLSGVRSHMECGGSPPLSAARACPGVLLASTRSRGLCPCFRRAQHAVPCKHTWRDAHHPPRSRRLSVGEQLRRSPVILSGVSRAFGFARSAGTPKRAPRSTVSRAWEIRRRTSLRCKLRAQHEGLPIARASSGACWATLRWTA